MSRSRTVRAMIRLQYCQAVFPCFHVHGLLLHFYPRGNEAPTASEATC